MNDMVNNILAARYFKNGETSRDQVYRRVADFVGDTKEERDTYFELMNNDVFLPNSPTLMNAGANKEPFMSACVVLPIDDSIDSIFSTIKNAAICHQRGAGCIAKGSNVFTKRGIIPIESVVVGDDVWSINQKTQKQSFKKVTDTHIYGVSDKTVVKVNFDRKNNYVITSDYHPFTVLTNDNTVEFVEAKDLEKGMKIIIGSTGKLGDVKVNKTAYDLGCKMKSNPNDIFVVPKTFTDSSILSYLAGILTDCEYNTYDDGSFEGDFDDYIQTIQCAPNDAFMSLLYTTKNEINRDIIVGLCSKIGIITENSINENGEYAIHIILQYQSSGHKLLSMMYPGIEYVSRYETIFHTISVDSIEPGNTDELYDLTVEENNTYFASTCGVMCFIHNTGFSFNELRPAGSLVRSSEGKASGPVSFLKNFDTATSTVSQGGSRRGANMGILNIDHPDILKFIKCKEVEGDIKNFNLSVMISDSFMKHVINKEFDIVISTDIDGHQNTVGELWSEIKQHVWRNGEPGVLFYDTINRDNVIPAVGKIVSTNPCCTADTLLLTSDGYVQIGNVVGKDVKVWNGETWSSVKPYFVASNQPVYKVEFSNGLSVKVTADHQWFTTDGVLKTSELKVNETTIKQCKYPTILTGFVNNDNEHGYVVNSENKDLLVKLLYTFNTMGLGGYIESNSNNVYTLHIANSYDIKPISITLCGTEDVYCCTEPLRHEIVINGIPSSNCGEQCLLPYESCTLGSINISKFVTGLHVDGYPLEECFDIEWFKTVVKQTTRFLDNVVSKNVFPIPELKDMAERTRKIGLGFMGVADAFIGMGIQYDSEEAVAIINDILRIFTETVFETSHELALERGEYPEYKRSIVMVNGSTPYKRNYFGIYNKYRGSMAPLRNSGVSTIAPTGTISLLAGCSSGLEPNFSYLYKRKNVVGGEYMVMHPMFEKIINSLNISEDRRKYIIDYMYEHGSIQDCKEFPDEYKRIFKTALDISPEWHIRMQAVFQSWITSSISKTINMPENTTPDQVGDAIIYAYNCGCKGLTMYRTNSRKDVVLNLADKKEEQKSSEPEIISVDHKKSTKFERGNPMVGSTYNIQSGCCKLYVTINHDPSNKIREVFVSNSGGNGGCTALLGSLGRMISLDLQNVSEEEEFLRVINSLEKTTCAACIRNRNAEAKSCSAAVAKCLKHESEYLKHESRESFVNTTLPKINIEEIVETVSGDKPDTWICPDCGATNVGIQGCKTCKTCGWSKCG